MKPVLVAASLLTAILAFQAIRPGRPRPVGTLRPDAARPAAGAPASAVLLFAGRLDLNAATAADLEALPGVGPARARAIVELRRARGGFGTVEELLDVPGIGPKTLEALRARVTVDPPVGRTHNP